MSNRDYKMRKNTPCSLAWCTANTQKIQKRPKKATPFFYAVATKYNI